MPVLQVRVGVAGSVRWASAAHWPACSKRDDGYDLGGRVEQDRKKAGEAGLRLLQNYYSTLDNPNVYGVLRPAGFAVNYAARY